MQKADITVTVESKIKLGSTVQNGVAFYYGISFQTLLSNWRTYFDYTATSETINYIPGNPLKGGSTYTTGNDYDPGITIQTVNSSDQGGWTWQNGEPLTTVPHASLGSGNIPIVKYVAVTYVPSDTRNYNEYAFKTSGGENTFQLCVIPARPDISSVNLVNQSSIPGAQGEGSYFYGQTRDQLKGTLSPTNNGFAINAVNVVNGVLGSSHWFWHNESIPNNYVLGIDKLNELLNKQLPDGTLVSALFVNNNNTVSNYYTAAELTVKFGGNTTLMNEVKQAFGVILQFGKTKVDSSEFDDYATVDNDALFLFIKYSVRQTTPVLVTTGTSGNQQWNGTQVSAGAIFAGQPLSKSTINVNNAKAINPFNGAVLDGGTFTWVDSGQVPACTWYQNAEGVPTSGLRAYTVLYTPGNTVNYRSTSSASDSAANNYGVKGELQLSIEVKRALVMPELTATNGVIAELDYGSTMQNLIINYTAYKVIPVDSLEEMTNYNL
jgi:hypothetical protein